jgi:hypothetical protein
MILAILEDVNDWFGELLGQSGDTKSILLEAEEQLFKWMERGVVLSHCVQNLAIDIL